jgi:hypothetical protein
MRARNFKADSERGTNVSINSYDQVLIAAPGLQALKIGFNEHFPSVDNQLMERLNEAASDALYLAPHGSVEVEKKSALAEAFFPFQSLGKDRAINQIFQKKYN